MFSVRFSGLIRRRTRWHRSLLSPGSSTPFSGTQLLQPTSFLTVFLLTVFLLSPCKPWEAPDRWKSRSSILPVSPWLEPREARELSHRMRTHRAEQQHRPVPLHQPSLRILSPSCQRRKFRVQLARPRTARDSLPIPPPHQPRHSQRPLWFQLLSQVTCGHTGLHTSQNLRVASK